MRVSKCFSVSIYKSHSQSAKCNLTNFIDLMNEYRVEGTFLKFGTFCARFLYVGNRKPFVNKMHPACQKNYFTKPSTFE